MDIRLAELGGERPRFAPEQSLQEEASELAAWDAAESGKDSDWTGYVDAEDVLARVAALVFQGRDDEARDALRAEVKPWVDMAVEKGWY